MTDLDALLDAAAKRKSESPHTETVEVLIGDDVWSLKFRELDSKVWAHVTASSPFRVDVRLDLNYGYNYHEATEKAGPLSGVRVTDEGDEELTPEQWEKVFGLLSGHDRGSVTDAIWKLNEYEPAQRLAKAKKALVAAQKQKRPSPAS